MTTRSYVGAVGLTLLLTAAALAGTISDDPGTPSSPGSGTIQAKGTYTLDGDTLISVTVYATPIGGGEGGEVVGTTVGLTWSGTVDGLPSGSYQVFTRARFRRPDLTEYNYDTAIKEVLVPTIGR